MPFRHYFVMNFVLLFVFIRGIANIFVPSTPQCYSPDGTVQDSDSPCNVSLEESACCNDADICLDNGLCLPQALQSNSFYRGSCTDQSWQSGECPQYCADSKLLSFPLVSSSMVLSLRIFHLTACSEFGWWNSDVPNRQFRHVLW